MANISILLFFCSLLVLGYALEQRAQLGPRPEDPLTRDGIAYEKAVLRQVTPWQRLTWAMLALSGGLFYVSDLCTTLLRS